MYGIVNKAIQELVIEQFGETVWDQVRLKSGVQEDFFISNQPYPDIVTYQLAGAVSEVTGLGLKDVLIAFGEFWVLNTGKQKYGSLMEAGGASLKEFLINLPNFHNRISLIYPNLKPPEFRISHIGDNSLRVHYYSERLGLEDFVTGLLQGLGKLYNSPVTTEMLERRADGGDHEIYNVSW